MILNKKVLEKVSFIAFAVTMASVSAVAGPGHSAAHRAAFEQCAEQLGLEKPVEGQRPVALDEETRAKMDACLKEKGFEAPKFGRKDHRGGRPPAATEDEGESSSGVQ